jgi:predicted nucleic-acid-binding protein
MESLEFGRNEALLTDIVFCEIVWVLSKVYKVARQDIAAQFGRVLRFQGIKTHCARELYLDALQHYATMPIDIQYCLLAALARSSDSEIVTFDKKDFKKLGCRFAEP